MKKILLLVFCFCAAGSLFAQTFKDQYFSAFGFSPYLDFGATPGIVKSPVYSNINGDTATYINQVTYWGVSFMYEGRYNITEPSENMAISIKAKPTISIAFADEGFGGFYIPIGIGLELGNGSTYKTTQNMGFTFTAGYSLNFIPLFGGESSDIASTYGVETSSSWGSPFIATGVRFWNKKNKLREINVLYGFGGGNDDIPANAKNIIGNSNNNSSFGPSFMLCISWMIFKNY